MKTAVHTIVVIHILLLLNVGYRHTVQAKNHHSHNRVAVDTQHAQRKLDEPVHEYVDDLDTDADTTGTGADVDAVVDESNNIATREEHQQQQEQVSDEADIVDLAANVDAGIEMDESLLLLEEVRPEAGEEGKDEDKKEGGKRKQEEASVDPTPHPTIKPTSAVGAADTTSYPSTEGALLTPATEEDIDLLHEIANIANDDDLQIGGTYVVENDEAFKHITADTFQPSSPPDSFSVEVVEDGDADDEKAEIEKEEGDADEADEMEEEIDIEEEEGTEEEGEEDILAEQEEATGLEDDSTINLTPSNHDDAVAIPKEEEEEEEEEVEEHEEEKEADVEKPIVNFAPPTHSGIAVNNPKVDDEDQAAIDEEESTGTVDADTIAIVEDVINEIETETPEPSAAVVEDGAEDEGEEGDMVDIIGMTTSPTVADIDHDETADARAFDPTAAPVLVEMESTGGEAHPFVWLAPTPQPTISSSPTGHHVWLPPTMKPTDEPTSTPSYSPTTLEPTSVPSSGPTTNPTAEPTNAPTDEPTQLPSSSPSSEPTDAPTLNPTVLPTNYVDADFATSAPTKKPTADPTTSPTPGPSSLPTNAPTPFPTPSPTISPSVLPSASPTANPSSQPTSAPTEGPTDAASDAPSTSPTETLTEGPSSAPSLVPSRAPSASPTASPSSTPSRKPSDVPSGEPSASPSAMPSLSPTSEPSLSPSSSPSALPSSIPSSSPTVVPSASPSESPTSIPSASPSSAPTSSPSVSPSSPPTQSLAPSVHPSFLPSSIPTNSPSTPPSALPSLSPTFMPSFSPSNNPSDIPSPSPSAAPTSTPTPESVAMETTFTIPLELNNNLTGGDAVVVQEVMKTFLELNQKVGADSKASAVVIEVAGVHVEEVVPRSTTGGIKRARSRMMKSKKSKQGGEESEDGVDSRSGGDSFAEDDSIIAVLDAPVTSEVSAKLRIICNVSPHRPHVVDPGFQFVPRLLGGFASDFQPFLDHLARTSATFKQQDFDPEVQERFVQPSQIPAASTAASSDATTTTPSPSIWNEMLDNRGLFIGIIVGASAFVMLLLSIIIIRWRTHTHSRNYNDADHDDESNAMDGEKRERPTVFYDNDGNEVYMTSKGQGYRHAVSAPTPTNASWRQHVNAANSTRSKKTFSVFSPKGVFPDGIESEAHAMHQEHLKEERRRHEWEEQQIGGSFAAPKFNDNSSVQELVINTEDSAGVDGIGSDSELSKKNKGHTALLSVMTPIALGKDNGIRTSRQDPTEAMVRSKLPPTTPRKYVRLDGDKNQLPPPDPPSHPRHASALQRKKKQSLG